MFDDKINFLCQHQQISHLEHNILDFSLLRKIPSRCVIMLTLYLAILNQHDYFSNVVKFVDFSLKMHVKVLESKQLKVCNFLNSRIVKI